MRTKLDSALDGIHLSPPLRRIGRDLHDQSSAISSATSDAMAAGVATLAFITDYGDLIESGFKEALMASSAVRHLGAASHSAESTEESRSQVGPTS